MEDFLDVVKILCYKNYFICNECSEISKSLEILDLADVSKV